MYGIQNILTILIISLFVSVYYWVTYQEAHFTNAEEYYAKLCLSNVQLTYLGLALFYKSLMGL